MTTEDAVQDMATLVDLRNLRVHFNLEEGTVKAVDDLNLKVKRGHVVGLVGESGCGKSVTALSLLGLIPHRYTHIEGQILFYRSSGTPVNIVDLDPKGKEIRAIRGKEIAMIFQEPMTSLNPVYTIGEQVMEGIILHRGLTRSEAKSLAIEMLEKVGISSPQKRIESYPHQLSGGMRQRVMIAIALSCNPSLLIADEPTTALDVTIQAQILDLMSKMQEESGSAVLMITHNLGIIAQMADEVAVMYMGQVVEYGATRALFHEPLHPYTQGLLNSIPHLGSDVQKRLTPIEGMVPNPYLRQKGCRFRQRCQRRTVACGEAEAELVELAKDHQVRCVLYR